MFTLLFGLGFLMGPAQPPRPAPANLETEVREALRRSALAGFVGTFTFQKEMWTRPGLQGEPYVLQSWEILTDGNGRLRAELSWPLNDSSSDFIVCQTHALMWLTGLNNEILVLDELNPPHSTKEIESKLSLVRGLAAQAQTDLEWLLDSLARRQSPIEILLLDRSPERTGAVVKIDNKLRQVTFSRVDGTLLLASITSDENQTTLRFEFKDHYRFGDRWIPRTVEFEEHHAQRGTMRALYSQLTLAEDQPGMPDFEEHFMIPEPENTNMTRVLAAEIFSQAFPGGVKMEIAPSFPQLGVMREAQK